jgi:hypothetical protein
MPHGHKEIHNRSDLVICDPRLHYVKINLDELITCGAKELKAIRLKLRRTNHQLTSHELEQQARRILITEQHQGLICKLLRENHIAFEIIDGEIEVSLDDQCIKSHIISNLADKLELH